MSSNVDDLLSGYLPQGAEAMNSVLQQYSWLAKKNTVPSGFVEMSFDKTKTSVRHERRFDTKGYSSRNTSIEIRHTVSRLDCKTSTSWQSTFENACVRDLRGCNRIVQNLLGMMRLFRRSLTPVPVKNRNNLTGSLRISSRHKLVSKLWHLLTRETPRRCSFTL